MHFILGGMMSDGCLQLLLEFDEASTMLPLSTQKYFGVRLWYFKDTAEVPLSPSTCQAPRYITPLVLSPKGILPLAPTNLEEV